MRRLSIFLCSTGLCTFLVTIYWGLSSVNFYGTGIKTRGVVVRLESGNHPVVQFHDLDGSLHEAHSYYGSTPPDYDIGSNVNVVYPKSKPEEARIDSLGDIYGGSIFYASLAISCFPCAYSLS